jgi:hypothetical protein
LPALHWSHSKGKGGGVLMDELKISWNKKITMREIAQFYEDKIRELDSRFQRLTEQTKALSEKFESKIEDLDQRAKIALDFLSKYDDVKDMIESERKNSFDSMRSMFETLQKRAQTVYEEATDRVVKAQKEGNIKGILRAQMEVDNIAAVFYQFIFDHDRSYFEKLHSGFKKAKAHPEVFLPAVYAHVSGDFDTVTDVALEMIKTMVDDYLQLISDIENGQKQEGF